MPLEEVGDGYPGIESAGKDRHPGIAFLLAFGCSPRRRSVLGSGTEEDDLLVSRDRSEVGFELLQGNRTIDLHSGAFLWIVLGAHDERRSEAQAKLVPQIPREKSTRFMHTDGLFLLFSPKAFNTRMSKTCAILEEPVSPAKVGRKAASLRRY
jgi:hypothetical protein